MVLETERESSHKLGRCSVTELDPQSFFYFSKLVLDLIKSPACPELIL